nr:codeine O-demethylase-like [Tanacetum cinerariifolium]
MALAQPLLNQESVQELAKEHNITVPDHYVQEHQEPTFVPNDCSLMPSIPIIDMNDLIMGGLNTDLHLKSLRSKIDWADRFYMSTNPLHRRKSNLLPEFPPLLRDTLENYLLELQKLGRTLFGLIGQAVDIDKEEMLEIFDDGMQSVRMTYYPPCPQPDLVVGLTPHSDATGITILLQVNNVEGLQVKKDGVWIPVNFLPDTFVVNVGEILEIMSNGVYNSIEHRAVVNATKERISLAMFFNPKLEPDVGPSKSLIKRTRNPPLYKTLTMEQYLKDFFSRKLNGKTFLENMKIKQDEADKT